MANLKKVTLSSLEKRTQAFPYQKETIDTVKELPYSAIFFEQGLGKTKIAIDLALIWLRSNIIDTVIIVTKKGLVRNWIQEFVIHSHIKPRVISSDRGANHSALFSSCRVFIANFEAIALEEKKIRTLTRHRKIAIILDESQKIKNPDSNLTQSFLRLSEYFLKRVIMTGTPMANRPYDIWSQIFFLDSGLSLGMDFKKFKESLDLPKDKHKAAFIDELESVYPKISEFAIRETKQSSGINLPGKVFRTVKAEWEPEQHAIYNSIREELCIEILKDGITILDSSESILKRMLRLTQAASNPGVIDDAYTQPPGKLSTLDGIVDKIISENEKVIIWTSFVKNCNFLTKHFGRDHAVQIHGRMAIADRDKSVQKFKANENVQILVATPAAAKEGLTLTIANHVIFYDRSFSLDDYLQAQDRIHRISQNKTCYVTNIVLPSSIDQWIDALINLKSAAVSVGMGDSNNEELNNLLDYDLSEILNEILNTESSDVE